MGCSGSKGVYQHTNSTQGVNEDTKKSDNREVSENLQKRETEQTESLEVEPAIPQTTDAMENGNENFLQVESPKIRPEHLIELPDVETNDQMETESKEGKSLNSLQKIGNGVEIILEENEKESEEVLGHTAGMGVNDEVLQFRPTFEDRSNAESMVDLTSAKVELLPVRGDIHPSAVEARPANNDLQPESDDLHPEHDDLQPESDDLQPERDDLQPESDDLQPKSDVLQPESDVLRPESDDLQPERDDLQPERDVLQPESDVLRPTSFEIQHARNDQQSSSDDLQLASLEPQSARDDPQTVGDDLLVVTRELLPPNEDLKAEINVSV